MPAEETVRLLRQIDIFASLERLAEVGVPRSYETGEVIFRAGDTGDTCFVLKSGSVKVTRTHSDGRSLTLAELRPGQIVGELAMFDGEVRSATVETLEPTAAVALLASDVRRLLRAQPEIAVKMLGGLADRLRDANERLFRQSFQTVAGRVASVLLGQIAARQAEGAGDHEVLIKATQADIAQLAGSSRESASRFLATLEREGVVTCGRGKVIVHDPETLRNYIY